MNAKPIVPVLGEQSWLCVYLQLSHSSLKTYNSSTFNYCYCQWTWRVTQSTPATVLSYCEIPGDIGIRTGIPPDTYFFSQTPRPINVDEGHNKYKYYYVKTINIQLIWSHFLQLNIFYLLSLITNKLQYTAEQFGNS